MRPEFVDNRDGNTLAEAIRKHLAWLLETRREAPDLSIATGYFNSGGFSRIADVLEKLPKVRLLLGAEPKPDIPHRTRLGQPKPEIFRQAAFRDALQAVEAGLRDELNLLGFSAETDRVLHRLVAFLRSGRAEVRRYEKEFLHGKAFLFADGEGVLSGSSNFTASGLVHNMELNLGNYQPHVVDQVRAWFSRLWNEAVPYDLASLYEARYREYDPYLIFLRVLWERYKNELGIEAAPQGPIPLTTFQTDGLERARHIIDQYHGVVIADGVGLGKSFIAGELIRRAAQERRQRVLLISPAALRDGPWRTFSHRFQLYLENISFEQLTEDQRLNPAGGRGVLKEHPDRYAMVVVDEAHALRNPDTDRARALRKLLQGTPPKELVLLTATPVNNSLWDLYYQLAYFVGHDAVFADLGIPSLKGRFEEAMRQDPYDLKPDALFDLLDKVTVRRTRNFVRRHYPNERILTSRGEEVLVRFPTPRVQRLDYDLEEALPGFLKELQEALAPEDGDPKLTMARYVPSMYRKGKKTPEVSQLALAGLLRSALLKRFESSVRAFANTCEGMAKAHDRFLEVLEKGFVATSELLGEWDEDTASDFWLDDLLAEAGAEKAGLYDVDELRRNVEADRDLLLKFAKRGRRLEADRDPKLKRLQESLVEILEQAEREGVTPEDRRDRRKVLVFSFYEDTVDWIENHLREVLKNDRRLALYRDRMASVAGRSSRGGISREAAVFGFVPISSEAPEGAEDQFDILIATDVLAEGVNLQQCRNIVNYDLPWNPMRLVQRHGRIDRIGSRYSEVFIRCFFPAAQLDALLNLEERLKSKLAQAAASVGVENAPLPGAPSGEVVFSDTRKEIEALREERSDLLENAGEDPHAHSGEEYRQILRKAMERRGDEIRSLPFGAGSGFANGLIKGHFFCIRVLDRVFLRFVPQGAKEIIRDSLRCLRLIDCSTETPRSVPDDLLKAVYGSWETARSDVYTEWTRATDPINLQPKVRPLFHQAAEHLRLNPPDDCTQQQLEDVLASLEAPWGMRIEREIRAVLTQQALPRAVSSAIVEKVRQLGLQPYRAPKPLDPIEKDEVQLVCWMAVS